MAHYVAGLAVECILRAYRYRIDPAFTARHDLRALYAESRFGERLAPEDAQRILAALAEVITRWSNSHRYRSEAALREYLRRAGLNGKGKFVKESSRRIVNAALMLVDQGALRWND